MELMKLSMSFWRDNTTVFEAQARSSALCGPSG